MNISPVYRFDSTSPISVLQALFYWSRSALGEPNGFKPEVKDVSSKKAPYAGVGRSGSISGGKKSGGVGSGVTAGAESDVSLSDYSEAGGSANDSTPCLFTADRGRRRGIKFGRETENTASLTPKNDVAKMTHANSNMTPQSRASDLPPLALALGGLATRGTRRRRRRHLDGTPLRRTDADISLLLSSSSSCSPFVVGTSPAAALADRVWIVGCTLFQRQPSIRILCEWLAKLSALGQCVSRLGSL